MKVRSSPRTLSHILLIIIQFYGQLWMPLISFQATTVSSWDDVVFIPPGFEVSSTPSRQNWLSVHLQNTICLELLCWVVAKFARYFVAGSGKFYLLIRNACFRMMIFFLPFYGLMKTIEFISLLNAFDSKKMAFYIWLGSPVKCFSHVAASFSRYPNSINMFMCDYSQILVPEQVYNQTILKFINVLK